MKNKVLLQKADFSVDAALRLLRPGNIGGTVLFIGTVRGKGPRGKVPHIDYEAYGTMAVKKMEEVRRSALRRFDIDDAVIIHRVGRIRAGGRVVLVAAAAAHRDAAFRACRFMLEALKKEVPIWKRELGAWTLGDGHGRRGARKLHGDGSRRKGSGGRGKDSTEMLRKNRGRERRKA